MSLLKHDQGFIPGDFPGTGVCTHVAIRAHVLNLWMYIIDFSTCICTCCRPHVLNLWTYISLDENV